MVGFGGLLDYLVDHTSTGCVHIYDNRYDSRREQLEARLSCYRQRRNVQLSILDDADLLDRIRDANLVVISCSTLGNGRLDGLLPACTRCGRVVLHGLGAAVHPKILFESGVRLVITTREHAGVAAAAKLDRTGLALQTLFEGGASWVSRWPKEKHAR